MAGLILFQYLKIRPGEPAARFWLNVPRRLKMEANIWHMGEGDRPADRMQGNFVGADMLNYIKEYGRSDLLSRIPLEKFRLCAQCEQR